MLAPEGDPANRPPDPRWQGPTTWGLNLVLVAMVASWLPHYLTWPWWTDLDAYAVMAQAWDDGVRPYRDFAAFNFPGQIYLFWLLGKAFGWGRTWPFYAVDAALVLGLCGGLVTWSLRGFGRTLPGLVGGFAVLAFYLDQDYTMVAQRDWQGPLLALSGLLAIQTLPGRAGRWVSAALMGLAVAIRPHVVLFLPALALAVADDARAPGESWKKAVGPLLEWSGALVVAMALAFAPLVGAGVWGDFLREIRRGGYGRRGTSASLGNIARGIVAQALTVPVAAVLIGLAVGSAAPFPRNEPKRWARAWLVAMGAALVYKGVHPLPHDYLIMPMALTRALASAMVVGLILEARGLPSVARLAGVALMLAMSLPGPRIPRFCDPSASVRAIPALARGEEPRERPPGYVQPPGREVPAHYTWRDYRDLLRYLRRETTPETPVANALRWFTAINGPIGRPSPFHGESGMVWAWVVDDHAEATYARALAALTGADSVVVWAPEEPNPVEMNVENLTREIRLSYQFEARFGPIEIWRRRPESP